VRRLTELTRSALPESMSRIPSINPERIGWCCSDRGITVSELSKNLGIDSARFAANSLRDEGLTFNQLRKLATFFSRGVLFFLDTGPVHANQLHSPQFRTITNQKPGLSAKVRSLIGRVERQRELYVSLLEDLGEELPDFETPNLSGRDIQNATIATREWLGLTAENHFEAFRSRVEDRGVLVFRSNGYAGAWQIPSDSTISGFSLYDQRCPVVFVRRLLPESRQTFTLIHELAHLLLHKKSFIDAEEDLYSMRGREREANQFAGLVLVPDDYLSQVHDASRPHDVSLFDGWLKPFKDQWGVSGEVILRRLLDTNRLGRTEYDDYRKFILANSASKAPDSGNRSYRHREPRHVFGAPFVRAVFDALHTEQISLSKASTYLDNLKIKDVRALEEHLANL
jgi:Zn-dependent peptidase ImmA (M78 family)